jgi:hypothetical protein
MSSFKVPFLKDRELDHHADEVLRKFAQSRGWTISAPVPVEHILEKHLGLTLEFKDLEVLLGQSGILGATWIKEELVRIDKSLQDGSGRYHFTVAHEIGHWQMHRPIMVLEREMPVLFAMPGGGPPPNIICRGNTGRDPMEWQADQFAARLLMPKKLMREAFGALFPAGLALPTELVASDRQLERQDWMNRVALEMVRKGGFENCSREAMRLRLEALKLVDCSGMRPLL